MLTTFGNKSKPTPQPVTSGSAYLSPEERAILLESLDGSIRVDGNRYKTTWNYGQSTFEALKKSIENNTLKPASERDKNAAFFTRLPEAITYPKIPTKSDASKVKKYIEKIFGVIQGEKHKKQCSNTYRLAR